MKFLFSYSIVILFLAIVSCKKENSPTFEEINNHYTTTDLSGFGNRPGKPTGAAFQLPINVVITSQIKGRVPDYISYNYYGIGTISTFFTLTNFNFKAVKVIFPAGIIFLPDNDSSQTVLSITPTEITMLPESSEKVLLKLFCINKSKNAGNVNFYTMNVVSNNNQVETLINHLRQKGDSVLLRHNASLQGIVWNISDGSGLTQADIDMINSW